MSERWRVEGIHGNVITIRLFAQGKSWHQDFLVRGDAHHDNRHADWSHELRHLEEAVERDAIILDVGDLFCVMQGKYDPRKDARAIRAEHVVEDYSDAVVRDAAEFYAPFAPNWVLVAEGNHETEYRKRNGTDLTRRLVGEVAVINPDSKMIAGNYGGWIRVLIERSTERASYMIRYFHGGQGGGRVTKGVLNCLRWGAEHPDADCTVTGHIHEAWHFPVARDRVTDAGRIYRDVSHFICTPGYKDEYGSGKGGFHVEKNRPPKPNGCAWLRLSMTPKKRGRRPKLAVTLDLEGG